MAEKNKDFQKIKKLIKIMKENDLIEVEIKHSDDKILVKRAAGQTPAVAAVPMIGQQMPVAAVENQTPQTKGDKGKDDGLVEIKSPMVGTFYATPSPDSDNYVELGSEVNSQSVVCIIEAMKVMNEIKADTNGKIEQILVTSGQAVEFGQVLFKVMPN